MTNFHPQQVVRTVALLKGKKTACIPVRVLTLKSSPIALTPMPGESNVLVVSTMDRQFLSFNIQSGNLNQSVKATDAANRDSATVSAMIITNMNNEGFRSPVIFGVSSNDRSVRGE